MHFKVHVVVVHEAYRVCVADVVVVEHVVGFVDPLVELLPAPVEILLVGVDHHPVVLDFDFNHPPVHAEQVYIVQTVVLHFVDQIDPFVFRPPNAQVVVEVDIVQPRDQTLFDWVGFDHLFDFFTLAVEEPVLQVVVALEVVLLDVEVDLVVVELLQMVLNVGELQVAEDLVLGDDVELEQTHGQSEREVGHAEAQFVVVRLVVLLDAFGVAAHALPGLYHRNVVQTHFEVLELVSILYEVFVHFYDVLLDGV
mmetsp:Transcript_34919/g.76262  ORF Transcript_34919/g.76262 Transcript_34919/m.76262 type:complete len:253 (+) Transcript_34919:560-1318(+)